MTRFKITYTFSKPPCLAYEVLATDEAHARRITEQFVKIEAPGCRIKKVQIVNRGEE